MKSYSQQAIFNNASLVAFYQAQIIVKRFPDPTHSQRPWRCHEVARAVKILLDDFRLNETDLPQLTVVDGKFDQADHSWLAFLESGGELRILDVYAVGSLPQVQLHDGCCIAVSYRNRYTPGHLPRPDIREPVIRQLVDGYRGYLEAFRKGAG